MIKSTIPIRITKTVLIKLSIIISIVNLTFFYSPSIGNADEALTYIFNLGSFLNLQLLTDSKYLPTTNNSYLVYATDSRVGINASNLLIAPATEMLNLSSSKPVSFSLNETDMKEDKLSSCTSCAVATESLYGIQNNASTVNNTMQVIPSEQPKQSRPATVAPKKISERKKTQKKVKTKINRKEKVIANKSVRMKHQGGLSHTQEVLVFNLSKARGAAENLLSLIFHR